MTAEIRSDGDRVGYFLFSIDTELAWGHFDGVPAGMFDSQGERERQTILRLLDILEEFNIVATWALVGHMFYDRCEKCDVCPVLEWKGKYESFREIYETDSRLWYGADIIDTLIQRGARHEIAFHGYTHRLFDETGMTEQDAQLEIREWLRVAGRKSILPKAVVFPQNRVGHLGLFKKHGFVCYRGDELLSENHYRLPLVGKALNLIDLILQIRAPQVYDAKAGQNQLINLPASRSLLRHRRKVDALLSGVDLNNLHIQKIVEGVEKAAAQRKVIHIYTHPYEFHTPGDFERLRQVFGAVARESENGRMSSVSMGHLAGLVQKRNPV